MHPSRLLLVFVLLTTPAAGAAPGIPADAYSDLSWRSVGPLRAGWAMCATGVPDRPDTFYFGAADGGVWTTNDAGRTWQGLFQHEAAASIGALAVAASDPRVIWVGTGQVTHRWDVTTGNGVFRSRDGGATWEARGLAESQHVGRLLVDPRDPDVVLVAALGHLFGPHPERGVFRTADGGATWEKTLYVDDTTGAVDLAADPAAPEVVYASTWQVRRFPWQAYFTPMAGPGSGVWKSTDAGRTWARLAGGLPENAGRIGLAVAPGSGGRVVYAVVDGDAGGLYRSADGGERFEHVNPDRGLGSAYFGRVMVDPRDADTVFLPGRSLRRSTDGGAHFEVMRGAPGGDDYHFLWINPEHPDHMITAADQGTVVSVNGGASWSSWYNQPTGQFYRVATDDRFPYWIYSGQQDSGTVAVASRSDYGQLTFRDWHPVGGDERDHDIPWPGDPNVVYGSGLGGRLTRWDARTGQVRNLSPWQVSTYGKRPTTVEQRTTWISPLAISPRPPHAIYTASQVLYRSLDGGETWAVISPDLTGAEAGAAATEGCAGDVPVERARACGYGVIFTIAPSPLETDRVWVGTDTGLVHLTRDGGATWRDVTPPGLADWSKVSRIDASPTDPATAYLAVDRHRSDDWRPYVYVTHDDGRTWRLANASLPDGAFVHAVRQDLARPGLLYAGTSRGVHVSFDDGASWQSLQLDLPTTGVTDLVVHDRDLVISTLGRGLWVLDDVTPLRRLSPELLATDAVLIPPAVAYRVSSNQNRDTPLPLDEPRRENPPAGAVIDYVLGPGVEGPVTLEFVDARGAVVARKSSDEARERPPADQYFADDWLQPPALPGTGPGHHRFVWDLRLPRPPALEYEYSIAAAPGDDTPALPRGAFVLPGRYTVRLAAGGWTVEQPLTVAMDPRVEVSMEALEAQQTFGRELSSTLGEIVAAVEGLEDGPLAATLRSVAGDLTALATDVEAADAAPNAAQERLLIESRARLAKAFAAARGGSEPTGQ